MLPTPPSPPPPGVSVAKVPVAAPHGPCVQPVLGSLSHSKTSVAGVNIPGTKPDCRARGVVRRPLGATEAGRVRGGGAARGAALTV